jgi:hypothetical protein
LHPLESAALSRRTPLADIDLLFDHFVGAAKQRERHIDT